MSDKAAQPWPVVVIPTYKPGAARVGIVEGLASLSCYVSLPVFLP